MKYIVAWDVAERSGYYGKLGNTVIMDEGSFEKCLKSFKLALKKFKNTKEPLKLAYYEDCHGFRRVVRKLGYFKGRVYESANQIWNGQVYVDYYHENNTFREVLGMRSKIIRANKKKAAVEIFQNDHPKKVIGGNDICDAYVLYLFNST